MGAAELRVLPVAALQQDSVILDNQDDHLVLTIRVPKDVIRNNLQLLMGLAEKSLGRDDIPAAPLPDPPTRKRKTPHWPYAALILGALALPSPFFFTNSLASYPPPVTIESVAPARPAFKVGEDIEIVIHYRRDRICQSTFDDLILRVGGDAMPIYNRRTYGASDQTLGEWKDFHLILKPPFLAPGDYFYTGYTHRECAQGGTFDSVYPNVAFTVVE